MKAKVVIAGLIALTLSNVSCSRAVEATSEPADANALSVPADQATTEERTAIRSTVQEISKKAAKFNYKNDFRAVPIVVTTEDATQTKRWGHCEWNEDGSGQYISIHREVFRHDKTDPRSSQVFAVLLHEIGHCYFGRQHEHRLIEKPGCSLMAGATAVVSAKSFPVSIMYTDESESAHPLSFLRSFQDYFVSELVGRPGLQTFEELKKLRGLKTLCEE